MSHPPSFYSCSHVPSCLSPSSTSYLLGPPSLPSLKWRPAGDNSRSTKWDSVGQSLDEGRYSPPPSGFALAALSSSSASSLLYRSSVCGIHETTSYNGRRARGREELQGDPSGWLKPPVDLDLGCSAILPGQQVATSQPAARTIGTKSTGAFNRPDGSPCTRCGSIPRPARSPSHSDPPAGRR